MRQRSTGKNCIGGDIPDGSPAVQEPLAGKLAHGRGLEELGDAQTGHLVELDLDVAEEFHRAVDADRVGAFGRVVCDG